MVTEITALNMNDLWKKLGKEETKMRRLETEIQKRKADLETEIQRYQEATENVKQQAENIKREAKGAVQWDGFWKKKYHALKAKHKIKTDSDDWEKSTGL